MAGQGYHLGLAKLVAGRLGKEFSDEMRVGVLVMDALNSAAGSRRASHFTGGAGCVLPQYTELRQVSKLQSWDSGYKKSFLVDPKINMRLFEVANIHIPEGDYKNGMRMHLLGDKAYDHFIQQILFDVNRQNEGIIIDRKTGKEMDGTSFRKEIYASYPLLDQYLMNLAGITAEEISESKELLVSVLTDEMASFVSKYLNFDSNLEWKDTSFFQKTGIDQVIEQSIEKACKYLEK